MVKSNLFCNLENKNLFERTVRKLSEWWFTHDYQKIFSWKLVSFIAICIRLSSKLFLNVFNLKTICDPLLASKIAVDKLISLPENTENNKLPGIDGISAEVLKVFWGQINILCVIL